MTTPKFSIIIPVYNVAPYLCECLDSVLAQTFTDWEVICVDDGSTDASGAILDEYASRDSRFLVVHQKNSGVSIARNVAMSRATGDWIGFLDADDVLDHNCLASVSSAITDGVEWIRMSSVDWYDNIPASVSNTSCTHQELDSVALVECISRCGLPFINYIKKSLVSGVGFPEGVRYREDAVFLFEVASRIRHCCLMGYVGYFRRCRAGSATYSPRLKDDHINLCKAFEGMVRRSYRDRIANQRVVAAFTYWMHKDIREWAAFCVDKSRLDERNVWIGDRNLYRSGLLGACTRGSLGDRIRWRLYLATGILRILLITKNNPMGRRIWRT